MDDKELLAAMRADAIAMANAILKYVQWDEANSTDMTCRYCDESVSHKADCVVLIARSYTRRPAY